jgi:hypothetical protein
MLFAGVSLLGTFRIRKPPFAVPLRRRVRLCTDILSLVFLGAILQLNWPCQRVAWMHLPISSMIF